MNSSLITSRAAWLIASLLFPIVLCASEEAPKPPFIATPSEGSRWIIDYTGDNKAKASEQKADALGMAGPDQKTTVVRVEVDKWKGKRRELTVWSTGERVEKWVLPEAAIFQQRGTDAIYIFPLRGAGRGAALSAVSAGETDFAEFEWITKDAFKETVEVEGRKCYLFEGARSPVSGGNNPASQGAESVSKQPALKAWVDVNTKLPVAILIGGVLRKYSFEDSAGPAKELPAAFSQQLSKYYETLHKATNHPMKL